MNILQELDRLNFYINRDGIATAEIKAKELIKVYLAASLATKQKQHTKKHPYRFVYLESAYSCRHILRAGLLNKELEHEL